MWTMRITQIWANLRAYTSNLNTMVDKAITQNGISVGFHVYIYAMDK